eukprot:TRINITY_DN94395_c0_g1_i1.p1 TRINITY_DN94395_c0_g1~~TRINITY_DN94395_c0_g1_i1.p1  ORF type:complete len:185 (+),score=32.03 TRINITY_DN94395_c0_g1_i1:120-674(+)
MGAALSGVEPQASDHRMYRVQLVVTRLVAGFSWLPQSAYHSSVVVDDYECYFGPDGISTVYSPKTIFSHAHLEAGPTEVVEVGFSKLSGTQLRELLQPFFQAGTYDMLRKNCNSFTDCALFCLLGMRLHEKYRSLEAVGATADDLFGLVQVISMGEYAPNPKALSFNSAQVMKAVASDNQAVFV